MRLINRTGEKKDYFLADGSLGMSNFLIKNYTWFYTCATQPSKPEEDGVYMCVCVCARSREHNIITCYYHKHAFYIIIIYCY